MPETLNALPLDVLTEARIEAPIQRCFEAMLQEMSQRMAYPDGTSMRMKLEPWPGGRWFRDLGDQGGHLWGHVQVIKPPKLLELTGPLFMSYPAINFVQVRLTSEGEVRTAVTLRHQAIGPIDEETRRGVSEGWRDMLEGAKSHAEHA